MHVDEEHEEDPGEDGEPREVVARPRTMGCLNVSASESDMKEKVLVIKLPRDRDAEADWECLGHLQETPSSGEVAGSHL